MRKSTQTHNSDNLAASSIFRRLKWTRLAVQLTLLPKHSNPRGRYRTRCIVLAGLLACLAVITPVAGNDRSCRSHKDRLIRFAPELFWLWERSRPGTKTAVEQGAVIVAADGENESEFIAYARASDKPANSLPPAFDTLVKESGDRLRYIIHSHPFKKGVPFEMSNGVRVTAKTQSEIDRPSSRDFSILPKGVLGFLVTRLGIRVYNRKGIRCSVQWEKLSINPNSQ